MADLTQMIQAAEVGANVASLWQPRSPARPLTLVNSSVSVGAAAEQVDALEASSEDVGQMVAAVEEALRNLRAKVGFGVHEQTGKLFVKIVDMTTGEVIKTIPPEELIKMAAKFLETREALGLIVDVSE